MMHLHAFLTWAMVGLIWHVQIVQYPLFHAVGETAFPTYHAGHCRRIAFLVVPLMLGEVATAALLVWQGERSVLFLASLGLIGLAWLSTALFQAPMHTRLMFGYSKRVVNSLVLTNWLRTFGWTARGLILGWLLTR